MDSATPTYAQLASQYFAQQWDAVLRWTDKMFAILMGAQWLFAIAAAVLISPYAWAGRDKALHVHVYAAVLLGGAISSLPIALALLRPGRLSTRVTIAVGQMLWSALLIHLTGGRIETHFHVFGSLAFLAFYRDWRVLVPATLVVAGDHLLRQIYFPQSVYGVLNPEWWRFLEHAWWVVFEDIILVFSCVFAVREMRTVAEKRAEAELLAESDRRKTVELDRALSELRRYHEESLGRVEKLAAVGQLAAAVGHELRNPLAAIRSAHTYLAKRISDPQASAASLQADKRVPQFLGIMEQELGACTRIISDLLDFARERPPVLRATPLQPLVDEAVALVPGRPQVTILNRVPEQLPIPLLDKDQFRQVLINLVQNAVEAMPNEGGEVTVEAEGGGATPWRLRVRDTGCGISPEVVEKIFEPLFTTKTKGTGLGLAIVAGMIRRHGGRIDVQTEVGKGSTFVVELPPQAIERAA